ncbi:MAG: pyridoxal-phosphate dependent enzyme [Ignavibacteria bacterium]|jgi:D-cysteine desulfhydrase|nr:pyridoxal-phosphate dependent enzyme [Ignavibacteria bacterium]MCU7503649.1 pyridoxal-phosphate dependent enzyme [Ignavibacteria bacterium]MCU7517868.1 pyridoxal-phosphate dependent enzyme [Ignavibacteria bacterium]
MQYPGRIPLANIPTPLVKVNFEGSNFRIKRDDFTGLELSGNKVRKLEFILYQAKKEGATTVFTCGGEQSNHSRATVAAAKAQGFKVKLFLWGKKSQKAEGNLFLDRFFGAEIIYLDKQEYLHVNSIMEKERLRDEENGEKVFIVPEGGSSALGIWGYINFIEELKLQLNLEKLKGILTACGSGGTSAGLMVGAALNNLSMKVYAVNVLYSASEMRNRILSLSEECIRQYKLPCRIDENNLVIMDGYSLEGYKQITQEKLEVIRSFAHSTGIILDPAYTGKAFYAFHENFLKGRNKTDVLFVHTGGLFGVFSKKEKYLAF